MVEEARYTFGSIERFEIDKWFSLVAMQEGLKIGNLVLVNLTGQLSKPYREKGFELAFNQLTDSGEIDLLGLEAIELYKSYLFRLRLPNVSFNVRAFQKKERIHGHLHRQPVIFQLASMAPITRVSFMKI